MSPARPRLETQLTIIFTPAMGKRMAWARMWLGVTQVHLAVLLLVAQSTISKIESGRMKVTHMFTYAKFLEVFGDATNYILTGSNAQKYERNSIWKANYRANNKRGHHAKAERELKNAKIYAQARKLVEQEIREAKGALSASDKETYVRKGVKDGAK